MQFNSKYTAASSLISELNKAKPCYEKCKRYLETGLDINSLYEDDENLLSAFIMDANEGQILVDGIQFFLANGFDVSRDKGKYGSMCLQALCYSTYDEYIVKAGKLLIAAGAIDIASDDGETARGLAATKASYHEVIDVDYSLSNTFEAYYQLLDSLWNGEISFDIDVYSSFKEKTINHVYALTKKESNAIYLHNGNEYAFEYQLYFESNDGFLVVDKYASSWMIKKLPSCLLEDVSSYFSWILGNRVEEVYYEAINTLKERTRPVLKMVMNTGKIVSISTNTVETDEEEDYRGIFRFEF